MPSLRQLPSLHCSQCSITWNRPELRPSATAHTAAGFLDMIVDRMPFPVKAIQVDGGSEFMAEFEDACQRRGIRLFPSQMGGHPQHLPATLGTRPDHTTGLLPKMRVERRAGVRHLLNEHID